MMIEKPRGELKDKKLELAALERKALDIIKTMKHFSFEEF
jgi:hypothetical protein